MQQRCVKVEYAGKVWSGLRIAARRKGVTTKIELSRIEGVVGDLHEERLTVAPYIDVYPVKETP